MNVIAWIVFGLIVGTIANFVDPRKDEGGLVGAIILGIVGAMVGGFLANLLFNIDITGFDFVSLAIAVFGSLALLFLGRGFRKA